MFMPSMILRHIKVLRNVQILRDVRSMVTFLLGDFNLGLPKGIDVSYLRA